MFNADQTEEFSRLGFIIERQLVDVDTCRKMLDVVHNSLHPPLGPLEFETDVQYLGSPAGRLSPGGDTPRRLLHAFTRDAVFRIWATSPKVAGRVKRLLASDHIAVSQNHHNCIMTKHPGFSSEHCGIRISATGCSTNRTWSVSGWRLVRNTPVMAVSD